MKTLTRREEEKVIKEVKAEALAKCGDPVRAYTECCTGRTISVAWRCRDHLKAMNDCLKPHTTEEILDTKRKALLAQRAA